jgi:hypothetical protein
MDRGISTVTINAMDGAMASRKIKEPMRLNTDTMMAGTVEQNVEDMPPMSEERRLTISAEWIPGVAMKDPFMMRENMAERMRLENRVMLQASSLCPHFDARRRASRRRHSRMASRPRARMS